MAKNDTEGTAGQPRTVVYLGNRKAISVTADGTREPHTGKRCTTIVLAPDSTLMDAARDITSPQGVWAAHSDAPAPAWVAAEGPLAGALTQILAAQWPGIEVREPETQEG